MYLIRHSFETLVGNKKKLSIWYSWEETQEYYILRVGIKKENNEA